MPLTDAQKQEHFQQLLDKLPHLFDNAKTKQEVFDIVIKALSELPHFHWTGIYEYETTQELLTLHPFYVGLPTDHVAIKKGVGVCGTAVAKNENIIVDDVRELDNYLACSVGTRSEIVVLLKDASKIYGQIDIDSDEVGAFSSKDQHYLEKIADQVITFLKSKNWL